MAYENILNLNGIDFTDDGRTWSESREERAATVQLASGKVKKYIMGEKKRWTISWDWLPNISACTSDGKGARDQLRPLAYTGNTYPLVIKSTSGVIETYTVFIESYSEELQRRDTINGHFYYKVDIELMEQ